MIKNIILTSVLISSFGLSQSLESKVRSLEKRVSELEKQLGNSGNQSSVPKKISNLKSLWRSLEKSMDKKDVEKILGEPDKVVKYSVLPEIWEYNYGSYNTGKVNFDYESLKVNGWSEPNFKNID